MKPDANDWYGHECEADPAPKPTIADRIRDVAEKMPDVHGDGLNRLADDLDDIADEIEEKAEELRGSLNPKVKDCDCHYCKVADSLARRKES